MHEYSLFLSILKVLEELLKPYRRPKVESLTLKIGQFSGIDAPYFMKVIETFKRGTPLEEAKIIFEEDPLRIFCFSCQKEVEPFGNKAQCPLCQGFQVKITGGLDLYIKSVEIEDEESPEN